MRRGWGRITLDEAIKNEEELAIQQIEKANALDNIPLFGMSEDDIEEIKECYKCSKEHEQLAEWLKELKQLREQMRWIPLNDRLCLPEKDGEYLVTVRGTTNRYYIILCGFALNLYEVDEYDFDNRRGIAGFYKYDSEYGYYEVLDAVAWMPLPEPYKASPTGVKSEGICLK